MSFGPRTLSKQMLLASVGAGRALGWPGVGLVASGVASGWLPGVDFRLTHGGSDGLAELAGLLAHGDPGRAPDAADVDGRSLADGEDAVLAVLGDMPESVLVLGSPAQVAEAVRLRVPAGRVLVCCQLGGPDSWAEVGLGEFPHWHGGLLLGRRLDVLRVVQWLRRTAGRPAPSVSRLDRWNLTRRSLALTPGGLRFAARLARRPRRGAPPGDPASTHVASERSSERRPGAGVLPMA